MQFIMEHFLLTREQFNQRLQSIVEGFNRIYDIAEVEEPEEYPLDQTREIWLRDFILYLELEL